MVNPYYPPGADADQYEGREYQRAYDMDAHDYRTPEEILEDAERVAEFIRRGIFITARDLEWKAGQR